MSSSKLFSPAQLGPIHLRNHVVMAPMTRSRAIGNVPQDITATYYEQRASAGLIITEGTSPSPNGLGYARIPGVFTHEQAPAWRKVTDAVHNRGGKIFVQLMHTGRVTHQDNLPAGGQVLAPSSIIAPGDMWTDQGGMQKNTEPVTMTEAQIKTAIADFAGAARLAVEEGGFDGVELHAANGYLLEQFLHPAANERTDEYGGSMENRSRFVLEVTAAVAQAIGKDRLGIRLSPFGAGGGMPGGFEQAEESYTYLAEQLNALDILYLHLVDHSAMGAPPVPAGIFTQIRSAFQNMVILCGNYDRARAEAALSNGEADLIAFGRPFLANPDLVERLADDAPLAQPDFNKFYTPGPEGYIDYPALVEATPG